MDLRFASNHEADDEIPYANESAKASYTPDLIVGCPASYGLAMKPRAHRGKVGVENIIPIEDGPREEVRS